MGVVLFLCTGCGTVLVDFDINATASIREEGGVATRVIEGVEVRRYPNALNPFEAVQFSDQGIVWTVTTGANGFGGMVKNLDTSQLCFRFDRARVASNFMPAGAPLIVNHAYLGKGRTIGSTLPEERPQLTPPAICLEPGEERELAFKPDMRGLFPNDRMFNVRWIDRRAELLESGIGNWFRFSVPLERSCKRQALDVTLTPKDARARTSYY